MANRTADLLVSVRSVAEAEAAIDGGAAIIDVKEPAAGPLGRADNATITAIVGCVNGRRPVSAAMGELLEASVLPPSGLTFVKWGLAGCRGLNWQTLFTAHAQHVETTAVLAAYADWQQADAPPLDEVCQFALERGGVLLIDTYQKQAANHAGERPNLLDWITVEALHRLCRRCHLASVAVALAGSLTAQHIELLRAVEPTWFAVRGAACSAGQRDGTIEVERVRRLVDRLQSASASALEA